MAPSWIGILISVGSGGKESRRFLKVTTRWASWRTCRARERSWKWLARTRGFGNWPIVEREGAYWGI